MRPPPRQAVPPWDLQIVLDGLSGPPFEPLEQADVRFLSLKAALLLALASAKRAGELCALSVQPSCLSFSEDGGLVHLWPNPGFQPKVISSAFRSRVIRIRAFCPPVEGSAADSQLRVLCPVRALRWRRQRRQPQLKNTSSRGNTAISTTRRNASPALEAELLAALRAAYPTTADVRAAMPELKAALQRHYCGPLYCG